MTHVICVISNAGRLGALKPPSGRTVREGGGVGGGGEIRLSGNYDTNNPAALGVRQGGLESVD